VQVVRLLSHEESDRVMRCCGLAYRGGGRFSAVVSGFQHSASEQRESSPSTTVYTRERVPTLPVSRHHNKRTDG
jgi:hypothetical protein